jgi:chorismate lyase
VGGAGSFAGTLDRHTGTVTEFLEHVAGEPVDADVLHRAHRPTDDGRVLGLGPDTPVNHRAVLLTGRASGRSFAYAESSIATGTVPPGMLARLETGRDPIGRVLTEHGLALRREPLAGPNGPRHAAGDVGTLVAAAVLVRRYRILLGDVAAMVIGEWFLPDAAAAFAGHLASAVHPRDRRAG